MSQLETIEQFYERNHKWMPDNLRGQIGHFNVFKLEPFIGDNPKPLPYIQRDYFKVSLFIGESKVEYADREFKIEKQALIFTNPFIPYSCVGPKRAGYFCIFNQNFFHQFGDLKQYSIFQPNGNHVFELTKEQLKTVKNIFGRMLEEVSSDYQHKYDLLRTLVLELVHFAMKMQPTSEQDRHPQNASQRISTMFMDLLERQFPVDENHPQVQLRSASDFAEHLNVHVNHLNRAVKEITQKTTSQVIAERILQESKVLLKHSEWNVSEIADSLGFTESTHFNNFFKKHTRLSPMKFKNV
jgi:AraC family transcriptional activator of pobA